MNPEKMTNTNETTTNSQRDAKGRFVQGNAGGPGNPLGRARTKWNSLATSEHVENVYKAVYEKAIDGCVAAMKLYLLRRPGDAPGAVKQRFFTVSAAVKQRLFPGLRSQGE